MFRRSCVCLGKGTDKYMKRNYLKWMTALVCAGVMVTVMSIADTSAVEVLAAEYNTATAEPVIFTDDLGRVITVEKPQRVEALLGGFADIWYLAGGEVIAAADDAWDDFDLPLPQDAVNLGMTKDLSLEKLFEADPDLVLASTNTKQNLEWKETLDAAGITTAYFDINNFDDYLRTLKIFTEITGRADLYEPLVTPPPGFEAEAKL